MRKVLAILLAALLLAGGTVAHAENGTNPSCGSGASGFAAEAGNLPEFDEALALAQQIGGQRVVAAGLLFAAGVKADGTCISAGEDAPDLSDWTEITAIAAGADSVAGLRSDGTVLCSDAGIDVEGWNDILRIDFNNFAFNEPFLLGLRSDGTVVAAGADFYGQCAVDEWRDVVDVSAGGAHSVALKSDGTVLACGNNDFGQCEVSDWENVVDVAAAGCSTWGLTAAGEILVAGSRPNDKGDYVLPAPQWDNAVAILADYEAGTGEDYVVGICEDGTLVSNRRGYLEEGELESFHDVQSVAVSSWGYTICSDSHGNVKAVGWDVDGQRRVEDWPQLKAAQPAGGEDSSDAEVGDEILFGRYEQDGDLTNGPEEIEWSVLAKKDGKLLLISKYCLSFQAYNHKRASVEWENCSLRAWLNADFLDAAFSEEEIARICPTVLSGLVDHLDEEASAETTDLIYILSRDELGRLYRLPEWNGGRNSDYAELVAYATVYAAREAGYDSNAEPVRWWERCKTGSALMGYICDIDGRTCSSAADINAILGIRPAVWITPQG